MLSSSLVRFAALSLISGCFVLSDASAQDTQSSSSADAAKVESVEIGNIRNVHRCGPLLMAGQPTVEDFALLAKQGITCVVTYRTDGEVTFDEQKAVEQAGMKFISMPYGTIDSLTDKVFDDTRKLLAQNKQSPMLLHCGAATRVAAVWVAYRVLDEGVAMDVAMEEAVKIGLRSKGLRERAVEYIKAQQKAGK